MNNLTKIASLPGSGAGRMSQLPAEVGETKKPQVQMKAAYFQDVPQTIESLARKYLKTCMGTGA